MSNKGQIGCLQGEIDGNVAIPQGIRSAVGIEESDFNHKESKCDKSGLGTRQGSLTKKKVPEVIVIDDDDEDGEVENHYDVEEVECFGEDFDSDAGSKQFPNCFYKSHGCQNADNSSAADSKLSASSDEEDCVVMEPGPSRAPLHVQKRMYTAQKRPHKVFKSSKMKSVSSNSSDCEIIEDPDGRVRQDWEEASLRKRLGNTLSSSRYRAESEGSTSASNLANSAAKQSTSGKQKGVQNQEQSKTFLSSPSIPKHSKEKGAMPVALDQQDSNSDCLDARLEDATTSIAEETSLANTSSSSVNDTVGSDFPDARQEEPTTSPGEEISLAQNNSSSSGNELEPFDERSTAYHSDTAIVGSIGELLSGMSPDLEGCDGPRASERVDDDDHAPQRNLAEAVQSMNHEGLPVDKERFKETEEFRLADEEEWARRQLELQRQALEVQRERKRRKVEASRRMEMENRQRQRLEEIRQSQQKEEQNLDYKEQVRGQIRSELERVAATCIDMATLLRRLGIQVDGGAFPTMQQVNAAYKKALLRFHPDRVAVMAKSDPSYQVEAEETFKLISRMKSTLQPVAVRYFT